MNGKKHTPESLLKMSKSQKGRPGYWKGRRLPDHVYDALRVAMLYGMVFYPIAAVLCWLAARQLKKGAQSGVDGVLA